MPVRRAHFLIVPLDGRGWGIRVRETVYGEFATHAAASEHAIQWARRMAVKGIEVRVLASRPSGQPHVVWTNDPLESLLGEGATAPSKDAQPN